ncbi:MAG TPA: hypothetical protein VMU15_09665 [Anaeromyxobacter sp.]|nr:hypothetical protein [Anaeromyxobacter sp.]
MRRGLLVGAHAIVYSRDAEADRAFFRDVLRLPGTDAGEGWMIFGLPPAELAVHPAERNGRHEIYLMVDDVDALVRSLRRKGVRCSPVREAGWGRLTRVTLPGGGILGVYEPQHRRAPRPRRRRARPSGGAPPR